MIKRIKQIKKVAIFKDFNWNSSIPDFKKYNAFYGWNGSGKTTITRILSALEKVELGNLELENDSICIIETDRTVLKLSKNDPVPDSIKNTIRVFNEDFITENLDWSTGKASPILIIGKEQIEQKEELERIIKKLVEKNRELEKKNNEKGNKAREKTKILEKARDEVIKNLRTIDDVKPKSGRANDYINYTVTDVENILKSGEELPLSDAEILQLRNSLREKEAKDLISDVKADFEWINNIINDAQKIFETIVLEEGLKLLSELQLDEKLKEWLRVGYEIHKDRRSPVICEFCKNKIPEERLRELGDYFSDVLRNLINKIDGIIEDITQHELPNIELQKSQFYNEFQNEFLNLNSTFNRQRNKANKELGKIKNLLAEKRNNLSQKVSFNFDILNEIITNLKNSIKQLNDLIRKNNDKTRSFKDKRIADAHRLEIGIINKYKSDYDEKVNYLKELQNNIDSLRREKEELEMQQRNLEQRLKEHHFASEEFNKLLRSFMGRNEIILETVDDGYVIKRNGRTASNLSESERNAIALIYFLIKLKEENFNAQNGIIVIDDPVSSFDSQHLYGAFGFIKEKIKELSPQQVFIFTHNFPFFRLIRDWMKYEGNIFSFYMIKSKINTTERYSTIEKLDKLLEKYNSEYNYLFKLIYNRKSAEDSNLEKDYIFPNVIRKFLENYISFKVPIGGVDIHKKFKYLCEDYPDIETEIKTRIESYCQDQSHPLYQDSPTDFDERLLGEIQSICEAIIRLIEKTDPKHYKRLLENLSN